MAQNAAVQKNSSGESGVMMTVPTPSSSEAFSSTAADNAGLHRREQHPRGIEQHPGRQGSRQRAQQPDPQRGLPGHAVSRPDPQRHHRRMVQVAGGQRVRPDPVIGLVRRQRHRLPPPPAGSASPPPARRRVGSPGAPDQGCRHRVVPDHADHRADRRRRRSRWCAAHTAPGRCRHWRSRRTRRPP